MELPDRDLARTLARVPGWGDPADLDVVPLHDGGNHRVYRVRCPDGRVGDRVLRIRSKGHLLGFRADLASEVAVLELLAGRGIAPQPVYADPEADVLVTAYVEGETWTPERLREEEGLARLARLLARIHEYHWAGPLFDAPGWVRHYLAGVESGGWLTGSIIKRLDGLFEGRGVPRPEGARLCHHDVIHTNLRGGPEPVLLDWEYAAAGHPFFDLATVCCYHDLSIEETAFFRAAYGEASGTAVETPLLDEFRVLVDCLTLAWGLARRDESLESDQVQALTLGAATRLGLDP